jgi:ribA/ribD-fused uncharacterized protein
MKYNMDWIFEKVKEEREQKYIFFWGHQPAKDGTITKTCFSQWWLSEFTVNGIQYKTAEHWMMAKKAELFSDEETLSKILNAKTPAEAKKLGREVKGYDDAKWLKKRLELVVEGNFYKFSQHKDLQEYLLSTNDRILVEASPVDAIWGVGLAADNPDINNPVNWKGLNLLGFALMEVRDKLKL